MAYIQQLNRSEDAHSRLNEHCSLNSSCNQRRIVLIAASAQQYALGRLLRQWRLSSLFQSEYKQENGSFWFEKVTTNSTYVRQYCPKHRL